MKSGLQFRRSATTVRGLHLLGAAAPRYAVPGTGGRSSGRASALGVTLALVATIAVSISGQGPTSEGPLKMRPYGQLAGCSEEPARFHPCAIEKAMTFNPPRTPDG